MRKIITLGFGFLVLSCCYSQDKTEKNYRNFPLTVSIQFHSLTLPFKNLRSNFSNVGFGIGTEVSHNGRQNWVQQFNISWFRNKVIGNGLFFSTQTVWRPTLVEHVFGEIKAGIGYQYAFRPVESFKPVEGNWMPVRHKGKGLLAFPVGISVGYNSYSEETYFSPFATYQFIILKGYNKSIPIVPETVLEAGTRIHF